MCCVFTQRTDGAGHTVFYICVAGILIIRLNRLSSVDLSNSSNKNKFYLYDAFESTLNFDYIDTTVTMNS